MKRVWAFDIGASNGRLMVNSFDGKYMYLEEIYRFPNFPVQVTNNYYWDILNIYSEMKKAMKKSIYKGFDQIESMGIDTWGVDFGLLSNTGEILCNPYSYRNPRNIEGMERVLDQISSDELFGLTGLEIASINTLFQLYTIKEANPKLLEQAETLLLTPNLLAYLFSGQKYNEFTISSTTQMLSAFDKDWDKNILDRLSLPKDLMAPIVEPYTIAGETLPAINKEMEMDPVKVTYTAGHDTACALAALPLEDDQSIFMSCGTWVLIGVPVDDPVTHANAMKWGFTSEGTMDGYYRLQKNNMGMWLLQQSRLIWEREGITTDYENENRLFMESEPLQSLIDPDHPSFFTPNNMIEAIQQFCRDTNQVVPKTQGEIIRCILESLALKYRWVINHLEILTGKKLKRIHMGGGAIRNQILCQLTANATELKVIAGPIEASSIGNAIGQWIALGEVKNIKEAREVVKRSFPLKEYKPQDSDKWEDKYNYFNENILQG
ncbi:rhamnulokinase [Saliterribacillus persicus]|uniref:Rhamnulokinase n=1 Tax=Saliterribacillus persicus TaxID=930114 RepID=A0A368YAD9_9BACI|nr:rhamnulokinase family protein [Saliterribacillus persicus]RCW77230.1 rhamnulokinase [Saliterribacillus persicus]